MAKRRPLGRKQAQFLYWLRRHGRWHPGCGWTWGTLSETVRLGDSLVRRGYAMRFYHGYPYYVPTSGPIPLEDRK